MALTDVPASGYGSNSARTHAEMQTYLEDLRNLINEAPHNNALTDLTISGGVLPEPTAQLIEVTGEGSTADTLDLITSANVPTGKMLVLTFENDIIVTHAAGSSGDDKRIFLLSEADETFTAKTDILIIYWTGTQWTEVFSYHDSDSVIDDVDANDDATVELHLGSSTFTRYELDITDLVVNTADVQLEMEVSTDGGSTWKTGASDYAWSLIGRDTNGNLASNADNADDSIILTNGGSGQGISADADSAYNATLILCDPKNASTKFIVQIVLIAYTHDISATEAIALSGMGQYLTAEAINAVRFKASSGNIASGNFKLRGI